MNKFYYFGGQSWSKETAHWTELSQIACLDSSSLTWSSVGHLNTGRNTHAVILVGNRFIIVGGGGTRHTESCELENGYFNCTNLNSVLTNYMATPPLFLVDDDYKNC